MFLDLNMPVMSGFETLQQIRDDILFKHIPVIAIYSTSVSLKTGLKRPLDWVPMPMSLNQLILMI
ncbi:hypothetical protein [Flavobacterium sp. LM4]|uniref:hypothetical protein n=1 Tax=Flavobacterium sp. LM4 TaxID=1938609 RepID=UPI001CB939B7